MTITNTKIYNFDTVKQIHEETTRLKETLRGFCIDLVLLDQKFKALDTIPVILNDIHDRLSTIEMFIKSDSEEKVEEYNNHQEKKRWGGKKNGLRPKKI